MSEAEHSRRRRRGKRRSKRNRKGRHNPGTSRSPHPIAVAAVLAIIGIGLMWMWFSAMDRAATDASMESGDEARAGDKTEFSLSELRLLSGPCPNCDAEISAADLLGL